jgi:hypothetical protein
MSEGLLCGEDDKDRCNLKVHKKLCIYAQFYVHGLSRSKFLRVIKEYKKRSFNCNAVFLGLFLAGCF